MHASFAPFRSPDLQLLVERALTTAGELIDRQWTPVYSYHGPEHTRRVVIAADAMALESGIDHESDRAALLVAAAFHDCGFFTDMNDHENIGAGIAADFLTALNAPLGMIGQVAHLIQATALHAQPVTVLQEILRDADLHYLGCDGFLSRAELLRQEWGATRNLEFSEVAWIEQNIRFMEQHRFHTPAAMRKYSEKKADNLRSLRKRLAALQIESA